MNSIIKVLAFACACLSGVSHAAIVDQVRCTIGLIAVDGSEGPSHEATFAVPRIPQIADDRWADGVLETGGSFEIGLRVGSDDYLDVSARVTYTFAYEGMSLAVPPAGLQTCVGWRVQRPGQGEGNSCAYMVNPPDSLPQDVWPNAPYDHENNVYIWPQAMWPQETLSGLGFGRDDQWRAATINCEVLETSR